MSRQGHVAPTHQQPERHVHHVEVGGGAVASADLSADGTVVRLRITLPHGRLSVAGCRDLVEAVFQLPELTEHCAVQATIPLGEPELLAGLRAHLTDVRTRAAGASCLIEASVR